MKNDPIVLRFFFTEGLAEEIGVEELRNVTQALEYCYRQVASLVGDVRQSKLYLLAGPQRGSIEFFLRPEVVFEINIRAVAISEFANPESLLEKVAEGGAFALALWSIVFRHRGIFDLWRRKEIPDNEELPSPVSEFKIRLSELALANPNVRDACERLATFALRSGADRVEIEVVPSAPVTIADRIERRGRGRAAPGYTRDPDRPHPTRITRNNDARTARVRYQGIEFDSFLAETYDRGNQVMIVALWGSQHAKPDNGTSADVDVQTLIIDDPEELEFIDDAPLVFDRAVFVAKVHGSREGYR